MGTGQGTGKHRRRARGRGRAAELSAQRVHAQIPATLSPSALLSAPGMPARAASLVRSPAAGRASQGRRRQNRACPRRESSPSATEVPVADCSEPRACAAHGHAAQTFFSLPLCNRPGCHEHPVNSPRNLARYCCPTCRQAVRNVLDRERKWYSRGTLDGQKKRGIEYQAAQRARFSARPCLRSATVTAAARVTVLPPPRRSSIIA